MVFFNKDLDSVKNAYVTPKKFTPDLRIFYTFPVFGFNVHVLGAYIKIMRFVAEMAILAKKNLRKKCVNRDKM